MNRMFHSNRIDDCGTKKTIPHIVGATDKEHYLWKSIEENGKTITLTKKNIDSYIGKTVNMYTILCCESYPYCKKCSGYHPLLKH